MFEIQVQFYTKTIRTWPSLVGRSLIITSISVWAIGLFKWLIWFNFDKWYLLRKSQISFRFFQFGGEIYLYNSLFIFSVSCYVLLFISKLLICVFLCRYLIWITVCQSYWFSQNTNSYFYWLFVLLFCSCMYFLFFYSRAFIVLLLVWDLSFLYFFSVGIWCYEIAF